MTVDKEILEASYHHPIIIFDGICMLCDRSIQWIMRHDKGEVFRFCTLQTTQVEKINSVVLIQQGATYIKSDAALMILSILGGRYRIASGIGKLVPQFLRDTIYDFIAKNRYRWFGKYDQCLIPNREWRNTD